MPNRAELPLIERGQGTGVREALIVALTFTAGGVDAICYFALGNVFTSVMTGNLVLLGLDAGEGDGSHALRSGAAVAAYVFAALVAAPWLPRASETNVWPRAMTAAVGAEAVLLGAVLGCWIAVGGEPTAPFVFALIGGYALAMGTQTAVGRGLGVEGVPTTYLTGTLSGVVADLARRSSASRSILWRVGVLVALVCGAAATSVLLRYAPTFAPVVPLVSATIVVIAALCVFWKNPNAEAPPAKEARAPRPSVE